MSLKFVKYFRGLKPAQKLELAASCGTTSDYLAKQSALISKGKAASLFKPAICSAIEIFSNSEVTRKDLRPDWADIWIELRIVDVPKKSLTQSTSES